MGKCTCTPTARHAWAVWVLGAPAPDEGEQQQLGSPLECAVGSGGPPRPCRAAGGHTGQAQPGGTRDGGRVILLSQQHLAGNYRSRWGRQGAVTPPFAFNPTIPLPAFPKASAASRLCSCFLVSQPQDSYLGPWSSGRTLPRCEPAGRLVITHTGSEGWLGVACAHLPGPAGPALATSSSKRPSKGQGALLPSWSTLPCSLRSLTVEDHVSCRSLFWIDEVTEVGGEPSVYTPGAGSAPTSSITNAPPQGHVFSHLEVPVAAGPPWEAF